MAARASVKERKGDEVAASDRTSPGKIVEFKSRRSPSEKPETRRVPRIEVAPRLRDEILAFVVFTLAVLTALPIVGLAGGSVLSLAGDGFALLLGLASIIVPFGLAIVAVELWRAGDAAQRTRRIVGGVVTLVSIVGLLGLQNLEGKVESAGGYAGLGVARGLMAIVGEVGAALVLLSIGIVGVFLVTGYDTREIADSWRRIRPRRRVPMPVLDLPENATTAIDSVETETYPVSEPEPATEATPVRLEPVPPPKPVINRPKSEQVTRKDPPAKKDDDVVPARPGAWKLPSLELLKTYESTEPDGPELESKARRIESTLASFKVEASVREIFPGPAVTLFTLEPGAGVKVRRITELQNDLALALAATSLRIEAPVPGMARVGLEIPNGSISTVGLREVLESATFVKSKAKIPLPMGRDVNGRYIIGDLTRMPHMLIAGATGSGKSVCINGIIATFLLTKSPDDLKMIMIDPKMVELSGYEGIPHLKSPVITEMDKVVPALRAVLREMERRYQTFSRLGVRNIDGYELRRSTDPTLEKLPYLVVIIDELADLMMTTPDEVETLLVRLAQMARATGIHLLIATQRPSVDVLTGLIKANVPARIAFAVSSQTDSRVILDVPGAERLLGRGDMLFMPADVAKPHRVQGSYVDDQELQALVRHWVMLAPEMQYEEEWVQLPSESSDDASEDPLFEQALSIVKQQGSASASMLQRRLRIGYNRAARLIEAMEDEGYIGPADGSRGRTVLVSDDDWDDE
ncbi:MAG: DNA translocase FtsK [Thermomicrobiales bacterium]|nr:DNA translocase FtsK [Thermomicrobiales bacterium]